MAKRRETLADIAARLFKRKSAETLELSDKFEALLGHPSYDIIKKFDKDILDNYKRQLIQESQQAVPDQIKVGVFGGIIRYLEDRLSRPEEIIRVAQEIREGRKKKRKRR